MFNIFVKRRIPTVCFAHGGINPYSGNVTVNQERTGRIFTEDKYIEFYFTLDDRITKFLQKSEKILKNNPEGTFGPIWLGEVPFFLPCCCMKQLPVLLVLSLKFIDLNMRGPK